jgi:hypothetical protein
VHPNRRASLGVHAVVNQVNWDVTCDPKFTDKYRLVPTVREEQSGGIEEWIYYGAPNEKFTGTKVTVRPGESFRCQDNGGYNVLVWDGKGTFNGYEIEGTATRLGDHKRDEFFVPYQTAKQGVKITNTGTTDLVLIKFFGPGVNDGITPLVKAYQPVK